MDLALLNPRLSAREAHAVGLVSPVVPDETFEGEVSAWPGGWPPARPRRTPRPSSS